MKFEIYSRRKLFKGKQWYWRLQAKNHEIIASGEGYKNWVDCMNAVDLVKQSDSASVHQLDPV